MKAKVNPCKLSGTISAPLSKSHLHRLLISAAMADGESHIYGVSDAEDVLATVNSLNALGANIARTDDGYTVIGHNMRKTAPRGTLNCRDSASTLRFLIPIATLSGARVYMVGSEALMKRPISVFQTLFDEREMLLAKMGRLITVDGPLEPGEFVLPGDVSSQFISGLMLALPVLDGDSNITIRPPFESKGYVDMTEAVLASFDVFVRKTDEYTYEIPGNQSYMPGEYYAEGDWSSAAVINALSYVGHNTEAVGLNENSKQPDKVAKQIFDRIAAKDSEPIDLSDCPDLAPAAFALAAELGGAHFIGVKRLSIKESHRAEAMKCELAKLGCNITVGDGYVTVPKAELHAPCEPISAHGDHRIAMAMAVLLTLYGGEILGAESINKSYPHFFEDLKTLGADIELYN